MEIQFQGGFSCKQLEILNKSEQNEDQIIETFYPEDVNMMQTFIFTNECGVSLKNIKLRLLKASDFFGRIIVYHLKLIGKTS